MTELLFERVDASDENVLAIRGMVADDLTRMGVNSTDAKDFAMNKQALIDQARRLRDHRSQYFGGFIANRLVAVSRINEWTARDQRNFAQSTPERHWLSLMSRVGNHVWGSPVGIHSLIVSRDLSTLDASVAQETFLKRALDKADREKKEVRIALQPSDPLRLSLIQEDFHRVTRDGDPLIGRPLPAFPDVTTELYNRPVHGFMYHFKEGVKEGYKELERKADRDES